MALVVQAVEQVIRMQQAVEVVQQQLVQQQLFQVQALVVLVHSLQSLVGQLLELVF